MHGFSVDLPEGDRRLIKIVNEDLIFRFPTQQALGRCKRCSEFLLDGKKTVPDLQSDISKKQQQQQRNIVSAGTQHNSQLCCFALLYWSGPLACITGNFPYK